MDLNKLRPATLAGIVVDLLEAIKDQQDVVFIRTKEALTAQEEENILQGADQKFKQLEASLEQAFDALIDTCGLFWAFDYIDKVKKSN